MKSRTRSDCARAERCGIPVYIVHTRGPARASRALSRHVSRAERGEQRRGEKRQEDEEQDAARARRVEALVRVFRELSIARPLPESDHELSRLFVPPALLPELLPERALVHRRLVAARRGDLVCVASRVRHVARRPHGARAASSDVISAFQKITPRGEQSSQHEPRANGDDIRRT